VDSAGFEQLDLSCDLAADPRFRHFVNQVLDAHDSQFTPRRQQLNPDDDSPSGQSLASL
jgi:hypothetical protein